MITRGLDSFHRFIILHLEKVWMKLISEMISCKKWKFKYEVTVPTLALFLNETKNRILDSSILISCRPKLQLPAFGGDMKTAS